MLKCLIFRSFDNLSKKIFIYPIIVHAILPSREYVLCSALFGHKHYRPQSPTPLGRGLNESRSKDRARSQSESSRTMSRNTALIKIIESVGKKVWLDHIIRTKFRLSAPLELQQIPNFYENSISLKD